MFDKEFVAKQKEVLTALCGPGLIQESLNQELQRLGLIYSRFSLPRPEGGGTQEVYVVGLHCGDDYSTGNPTFKPLNFWSSIFIFFFGESGLDRMERIDTDLETLNQLLTIGKYFGGFDGQNEYFY
ncbi:hypothetical protein HYS10_01425 [Candidatus Collierbacteria bacterium]|nr:hypothetical protein [Candidatus Collierbacteria bacterium]